jgi:p-aminobenzoyl-glutamate transporter AbgT
MVKDRLIAASIAGIAGSCSNVILGVIFNLCTGLTELFMTIRQHYLVK